jgi:undecaprenyl pyrophosphate phosphatase UppP
LDVFLAPHHRSQAVAQLFSLGHIRTMSTASAHRISWMHYFCAAVASYLSPWLAAFVVDLFIHRFLGFPYSRFQPRDPIPPFSSFLLALIPAAISFIILLPFLRSRSRRLFAYLFICAGWVLLFWFTRADTR